MTYVQQVSYCVGSSDDRVIMAWKTKARRDGVDLGPPWLPSDEGVLYGTREVDRPLPPHRVGFPPLRVDPAPLRLWPVPVVFGCAALAGLIAGIVR